jgi:hypothetical protein
MRGRDSEAELRAWTDRINSIAATQSAPQLAAPMGNSAVFLRPVLPTSKSKSTQVRDFCERGLPQSRSDVHARKVATAECPSRNVARGSAEA